MHFLILVNSHLLNIPKDINCDCSIAGEDNESKKIAMELINKIPEIKSIDCRTLEKSRIIEKITPY